MNKIDKQNTEDYYFECNGKNINLYDFINNYNVKNIKDKVIIYIKNTKDIDVNGNNHIKVRTKKPYDFYINYHSIEEGAFINTFINIDNKKKSELKTTLENINEYILKIIPNVKINLSYIENPNKNNNNRLTFVCKFIPDLKTKNHRIYEIKEYLSKLLWNKDKFPIERAKKGYTELSEFKNKMIEVNKNKQQLKIFPDFEPILKIQNINNSVVVSIEYNIRQIYFIKPNIIPDPIE